MSFDSGGGFDHHGDVDWAWSDFFGGDLGQNRRLRGLEESRAAHRADTARLRAELSKATGSLEERLAKLSAAFDAFVELSQLGPRLELFDREAEARRLARSLFAGVDRLDEVVDVPGYWLPQALLAVRALRTGGDVATPLALAVERDAASTAVFHVLTAGVFGFGESVPAGMLGEALPEFTDPLPTSVRAVWVLAADGYYGAAGRKLAEQRGATHLARRPPEEVAAAVTTWRQALKPDHEAEYKLPQGIADGPRLRTIADACTRIALLRAHVRQALAPRPDQRDELDPLVKSTLERVVETGAPREQELLGRVRELRATVGGGSPDELPEHAGDPAALLRADGVDEARPGRRALALRASSRDVLATAEQLAADAATELPEEVSVRPGVGTMVVRGGRVAEQSVERAAARGVPEVDGTRRVVGAALAGVALVALVLALVAGWGWAVPAVLAAGGAAVQLTRHAKAGRERVAALEQGRARAAREAEQAERIAAAALADLRGRQERAARDLAELRHLLGA
ncbi:hypothetical protein [Actinokineospora bangkokensis]|uniref:Uncharacterized protein n=1 Tax=Actinokineospora bangkokensis TaxID=1193682 RepID=A0A1Q9LD75_9PSEU|nr:hypothetical protein [Actinokineospora bangkokensis]OLR89988.1 hypothetical protein BJP25_03130 [Actinokineospora bangkokensis]